MATNNNNSNHNNNEVDYATLASQRKFSTLRQLIQEGHDVQKIFQSVGLHLVVGPRYRDGIVFLKELIEIHGVNIQVSLITVMHSIVD